MPNLDSFLQVELLQQCWEIKKGKHVAALHHGDFV
jgi:hypothetical protein